MILRRGAKLMYDWLAARECGEIHPKKTILEAGDWADASLKTYLKKNKLAPFILQLSDGNFKVLMKGSDISERYFHETFTQTAPAKVTLNSGEKVLANNGTYELIEPIGRGAVGHVWSAKTSSSGVVELVAVKIMLPREDLLSASQLSNVRERFRREGINGKTLSHENIVKYLDFGEVQNNPFIVMELAEKSIGTNLFISNPIVHEEAYEIVRDCINGLIYLHGKGCPHRDIKPDNILMFEGLYKLGDLGIVKWSDFDESITKGGTITRESMQLGSWFYMAPEQQVAPHDAVPESDVYALGISYIEMLTGVIPPPQAIGVQAYTLPNDIDPKLGEVIHNMLQYDFNNRPKMRELKISLDEIYS